MSQRARTTALVAASTATLLVLPLGPLALASGPAAADEAPGAPGAAATWRSGDKDGVGTSLSRTSKVWYTLADGTLSETYYPAADTPNVRDLQFAVSDGRRPASGRRTTRSCGPSELADPTSLTYRQTSTDKAGAGGSPRRTSPTRRGRRSWSASTSRPWPAGRTSSSPSTTRRWPAPRPTTAAPPAGGALVATDTHLADRPVASALVASTGFTATSTGYVGTSDGWTDLADGRLDATYATAGPGNIAQTGQVPVSGATTTFTLALGLRRRRRGGDLRRRSASLGHGVRRRRRGVPARVERLPRPA